MSYRDENESLRRRVAELERETAELRKQLEEPKVSAPTETGDPPARPRHRPPTRFAPPPRWASAWRALSPFRPWVLGALLVVLLVVAARSGVFPRQKGFDEMYPIVVHGKLQGEGWVLAPKSCTSGQREAYFGVELAEEGQRRIRIVQDPMSASFIVTLFRPGAQAPIALREPCVQASLEKTNISMNGIHYMNGRMHVDCAMPDEAGRRVQGDLEFWGCH